jgi:hypothetical protein
VQVRLEASLFRAVRVDGQGGEPRRAVPVPEGRPDDGGDAGSAADLPDWVQAVVRGRHPLAAPLLPAPLVPAAKQPQVVPREGELREHHQPGAVRVGVLDEAHMLWHIGVDAAVQGRVLDGGYGQRCSHEPILGRVDSRAVALDGGLPQRFGPQGESLRGADVVEQLRGRQRIDVRFGQAACQLRPRRLGGERNAFPAPLDVLGRLPCHELPEEEVHHAGAHRLQRITPARTTPGRVSPGCTGPEGVTLEPVPTKLAPFQLVACRVP